MPDLAANREKRARRIRKLIDTRNSLGDKALAHIHEIDGAYIFYSIFRPSPVLDYSADLPEECIMALTDEIPILLQYFYTAYMNSDLFFEVANSECVVRAYKWYR